MVKKKSTVLEGPDAPPGWDTILDKTVDDFIKLEPDDVIEGIYQGPWEIGDGTVYIIKTKDGQMMGLNGGRVVLDRKMEKIPFDSEIMIWRGEDTIAKVSGRPVAQYTVHFKAPFEAPKI